MIQKIFYSRTRLENHALQFTVFADRNAVVDMRVGTATLMEAGEASTASTKWAALVQVLYVGWAQGCAI